MPVEPVKHKVRGIEVRMLRGGSGPPLLFLHGANGLTPWLPFFENLSKTFEVLVPEHPGFGLSDNPPWIRNVGDLAMYYLDFIDGLGAGKVHLVGQSLGGWTAAELAVRNDTKLASLSLLAPAGIRVKGTIAGDNFIWGPEEAVRNLFHDQSFADTMLAQIGAFTDEQNDIALTNRYAATKFGWEPRWFNPALERWLHRISVCLAGAVGRARQAVPRGLCGALGRAHSRQPRRDAARLRTRHQHREGRRPPPTP